ncbi:MAG: FAD-dependent oxidoreductase [Methylobacillus sp.]|jgi:glycine oxidase|nr:FAD-dependent oxidoreductase [Methylobacillus sp.]
MKPTITIIGAGAIGCLTALTFASHGWNVTLIDRSRLGGEASWAGGGILFPLLPWNYPDEVNEFVFAGTSRYAALCAELRDTTGIDPEYSECGMRIFPEFDARALAWCQAHGIPAELQNETLLLPKVAQARNPRLLAALKARLLALGVTLREHTELLPLQSETRRITAWQSKDGQRFSSDIYVVAAGAWSAPLLGEFAADVPIKPMRGQMLLYKLESPVFTEILYREDFYLVPRRDGHVLAGSTMEDVGFDKSATVEAGEALARKAAALLPALKHAPIVQHWSGLRPGSPDNIPLIGRHAGFDNLYLNTGHFRYGVTMAPVSAERLFEQVAGLN